MRQNIMCGIGRLCLGTSCRYAINAAIAAVVSSPRLIGPLQLVLCIIGNILALTLLTIDLRLFLRGRNIALDLFLTIVLFVGCFLAIAGAIPSLNWNADDWYNNDDPSGLGYKIITPEGTQPWMPPHDDTPCSGFSSCAEQDAFTTKTHHRAMVELVGGVFTIVAV